MKIRAANSTGRPEHQFVVEAESDDDTILLKSFLTARQNSKEKLVLIMHGYTVSQDNKYTSFNFGWMSKKEINRIKKLVK